MPWLSTLGLSTNMHHNAHNTITTAAQLVVYLPRQYETAVNWNNLLTAPLHLVSFGTPANAAQERRLRLLCHTSLTDISSQE